MSITERIIAHRGASAYSPENTLAAFAKAGAMGCPVVEFDVMLSADLQPFVFHDDALSRTTGARGEFSSATAAFISRLSAGSWFADIYHNEKIPTLHETIQLLTAKNMQANIEIKPVNGMIEQTVSIILGEILRYWPYDKPLPLVSSFDVNALKLCRSIAPEMPLGLLLDAWQDNWLSVAKQLSCFSVHINQRVLNARRVSLVKATKHKLFAYTVNHKRRANQLLSWGVDAIFSDYPDLLA
ncbi:MAG: glycerophosphoryl diester phosphodiesterase [Legionella sp.]